MQIAGFTGLVAFLIIGTLLFAAYQLGKSETFG